jgi:ABC-type Fe3+/spermidine/putrescine transport system ATPase subunit
VGGTNLFVGVVVGGVLRCAGAGASFFVGDRVAAGLAALGVRPERVVMRAAGEGRVEGVVESVAFLGARWLVQARLAGGMVVRVEVAARPEAERVGLDWAETDVMVFAGAA